ncbi:MAG: TolC family protein, partial [Calditrichaeota bacterium]|nr:TolC family protein [Calditrichota bacterium]
MNLRHCEELALQNNLDIEEARLSLEFSEARRVQAAHANILPKLEFKQVLGTSTRARGVFN